MDEDVKEKIGVIIYYFWWVIPVLIGVFCIFHFEVPKKIGDWWAENVTKEEYNICHLSEGCNMGSPTYYSQSQPIFKEDSNSCPLIGGKACIVDEWDPICLVKDCIIDSRK